jgi:hypothetical protein
MNDPAKKTRRQYKQKREQEKKNKITRVRIRSRFKVKLTPTNFLGETTPKNESKIKILGLVTRECDIS